MYEVTVIWPPGRKGAHGPTFRAKNGALIEPLTDHVQAIAKALYDQRKSETAYRSVMDPLVNALTHFAEYLASRGVDWQNEQTPLGEVEKTEEIAEPLPSHIRHWLDIDGAFLEQYRDWELARVKANPASKDDEDANQKTVNKKLICIYGLYVWAQDTVCYADNLVGWTMFYQIRSCLCSASNVQTQPTFEDRYPLCFATTANGTAYGQHWSTQDEMRDLAAYFDEHSQSPLVAERDILLVHIGQYLGFRAGSASSLTTNLFSDREIATQMKRHRDEFLVTPPVQKNGHKFAFGVPWSLALRINAYIYDGISDDSHGAVACGLSKEGVTRPIGGRARLILASGKSPRNGQNRIFLSSRDATPLSAHTIVNRFAKALKAVGAPKGSGYHSLRRGMMDEFADETMDKRRRKGLSTAREDVLQDFEDKLGHTTGNSLHAYIRASRRTTKQTTEEKQHDDLVASSIEIEQLMARLAYQDQHIRESAKAKSRSRKARID